MVKKEYLTIRYDTALSLRNIVLKISIINKKTISCTEKDEPFIVPSITIQHYYRFLSNFT